MRGRLLMKALVTVASVIGLKLLMHALGWEFLSINPLFSGIIAANVFVMGFLLSGVLSDYKESERLPGELACSLEVIADEVRALYRSKQAPAAEECYRRTLELAVSLRDWFHKKRKTREVRAQIDALGESLSALESLLQANFIVRLKQEQSGIRRILVRIHTIREADFIASGYLLAKITTGLLLIGLIFARIDPFYESLFFVGVISFLLVFLNFLIHDLDNPFGYYESGSTEDISLKPMDDMIRELSEPLRQEQR